MWFKRCLVARSTRSRDRREAESRRSSAWRPHWRKAFASSAVRPGCFWTHEPCSCMVLCSAGNLQPLSNLFQQRGSMTLAGGPSAATYPKGRGSVRRVVTLAAQLLLPINGLCSKLKLVPISLVSKAGSACVDALKAPSGVRRTGACFGPFLASCPTRKLRLSH